ncbi:hypothetical protein LAD77_00800 [Klebsiella pneumoniae]|nr:hypothetical protein [Klebsiella pneumoniae]
MHERNSFLYCRRVSLLSDCLSTFLAADGLPDRQSQAEALSREKNRRWLQNLGASDSSDASHKHRLGRLIYLPPVRFYTAELGVGH